MGREPVDIHMDKKQNGVIANSNGSSNSNIKVHVSSKISEDSVETDEVKKECTEQNSVAENDDTSESQEVLGVKSTNLEGRKDKNGSQKSSDHKKLSSSPSLKSPRGDGIRTVPKPFTLATEKRASSASRSAGTDNSSSGNANSSISPTASRGSQPNSPLTARKSTEYKKHQDEEDNWSIASSSATSAKTVKPKITVGVAPTFRSTQRLERRKEFYQKLEEKHKALDAEKRESEQRLKEEQEAAIKLMRKNMTYRANPVPTFYYEGPPPKTELKKLPLTRPKSPNLNRRKSCSDAAVNSSCQEEKARHCSRHRHSVDGCKEESKATNSPRFKAQMNNNNNNNNSPRTPKINNKDHLKKATKGTPKSAKSAPEKLTTEETQKNNKTEEITKPTEEEIAKPTEEEIGEINEETNTADNYVVAAA